MHHPEIALNLVKADDDPVGSDRKRRVKSIVARCSMKVLHRKRLTYRPFRHRIEPKGPEADKPIPVGGEIHHLAVTRPLRICIEMLQIRERNPPARSHWSILVGGSNKQLFELAYRSRSRLKNNPAPVGGVRVVVVRCVFSRALRQPTSIRLPWKGGFALTAPNSTQRLAKLTNAPAPALYVCSDSGLGSNVTLSRCIFLAYSLYPVPKTLSIPIGFAQFRGPVLYSKLRNRIRIP
jgi:hypothetical protein